MVPLTFYAQKEALERKRNQLNQAIKLTKETIDVTKKNKAFAQEEFLALKEQVAVRNELVETIQAEIDQIDNSIDRNKDIIAALEKDLEHVKEDYGRMLREAYRFRMTQNRTFYLLSSSNFRQALLRWRYMKRYDQYRKNQASMIANTQSSLEGKLKKFQSRRLEKISLKEEEAKQRTQLKNDLKKKEKLFKLLQSKSFKLDRKLNKQKEEREALFDQIENFIIAEVKNQRKEARAPKTPEKKTVKPTSSSDRAIGDAFRKSKGKLPWPVKTGNISGRYGEQSHPINKKLKIRNNGIDIRTNQQAEVRTVFEGEVVSVFYDTALKYAIMVKHGPYYSAYANIKETFVQKGDKVKQKQALGIVETKNGKTELHFEIWRERHCQNPASWISK